MLSTTNAPRGSVIQRLVKGFTFENIRTHTRLLAEQANASGQYHPPQRREAPYPLTARRLGPDGAVCPALDGHIDGAGRIASGDMA